MIIDMIKETYTQEETYIFAASLAGKIKPGSVVALIGDLGVGKTVFSQGFAKGIGVEEAITSPTFNIVLVYEDGVMPFYHFDVYRISDSDEMFEIGYEEYINGDGVCLIEWANLIDDILPLDCIKVTIEKDLEIGCDYRKITVENGGELIEDISTR